MKLCSKVKVVEDEEPKTGDIKCVIATVVTSEIINNL